MLPLLLSEVYNSTCLYYADVCKAGFNWNSTYIFSNFNPLNTDAPLLQTVFCFVPWESPNILSKFNPLNTDTPLIWTISMAPQSPY